MAEPVIFNFTVVSGTTEPMRFLIFDEQNVPVSLVGAKIWFTIKNALSDLDEAALVFINSTDDAAQFDVTAGISGSYDLTLTYAQMTLLVADNYEWCHKVHLADGRYSEPTRGTVYVLQGGIRAT